MEKQVNDLQKMSTFPDKIGKRQNYKIEKRQNSEFEKYDLY